MISKNPNRRERAKSMSEHYHSKDKQRQVWDPPETVPVPATPYQRHSETSMAAAVQAEPSVKTWLGAVLIWLRLQDDTGATDEEMQERMNINPSTQRPRRGDLVNRGLVVDSGRTRPTRSGRKATVWVAKESR